MATINILTKEQAEDLPRFREECRALALASPVVTDDEMRQVVKRLYASRGLKEPGVLVLNGPEHCLLARAFLRSVSTLDLKGQLKGQLLDQLWGQLGDQLKGQLGGQLRDQLRGQEAYDTLWFAGGSEFYWIALYQFAQRIGVKFTDEQSSALEAWGEYARLCGPLYAYDGAAFVSRRPDVLRFDDQQRLHSETGAAMSFPSGYALHAWHGVRVPEKWICERETLSAQEVMSAQNLEVRRAGIEILGWAKILDQLHGRLIEADDDPEIGSVIELKLPDLDRPHQFLRVRCATGRDFALCLPPDFRASRGYSLPHCAQAFLAGLTPAEWRKPSITA